MSVRLSRVTLSIHVVAFRLTDARNEARHAPVVGKSHRPGFIHRRRLSRARGLFAVLRRSFPIFATLRGKRAWTFDNASTIDYFEAEGGESGCGDTLEAFTQRFLMSRARLMIIIRVFTRFFRCCPKPGKDDQYSANVIRGSRAPTVSTRNNATIHKIPVHPAPRYKQTPRNSNARECVRERNPCNARVIVRRQQK